MIEVIQFFKWVGRSACAGTQKWVTEMYNSTITVMSAFPLLASLGWVLLCSIMSAVAGAVTVLLTGDRVLAVVIAYNIVPVIVLLWFATITRVLWIKFKQSQQDIIDRLKHEGN